MSTTLTASVDGSYTAPATINVHFLDDGSDVGFEDQGTFTDAAGHTFLFDGWTAYETQQAMLAFAQFSAVANVSFNFVTDVALADFVMVTGDAEEVGELGYWNVGGGTITVNGVDHEVDGVGVFNWEGQGWDYIGTAGSLEPGGLGFVTLLDNIGRGLGLAYPHSTDGGSTVMAGVDAPTGDFGDFDLNQGLYTTMSLNDGRPAGPQGLTPSDSFGWQASPMALDIAVLQETYGANTATNLGNTLYELPDTQAVGTFYQAIWDAGGIDTIAYDGNGHAVIDLRAATLQSEAGGGGFLSFVAGIHGGFTIASGVVIENATGGAGNDTITGNAIANVLTGGAGADALNGGGGTDTASYHNAAAAVVADLLNAANNQGEALGDTYDSIENLQGGNFGDRLVGNADSNAISGGAGNDVLLGGDGDDSLNGDAGDDSMSGNAGADVLVAGDGNDVLGGEGGDDNLSGGAGADRLFGGDDNDILAGDDGEDRLNGGGGDDQLFGGNDNDALIGSNGNDGLFGQVGADLLQGGSGNDVLDGGQGNDRLFGQVGDDRLNGAGGGDYLNGGSGNDRLMGRSGSDSLSGGWGADRLYGGFGNDVLSGGNDNDILMGEQGNDTLIGNAGADRFVFQPGGGDDRVLDFLDDIDRLDFGLFDFDSKDAVLDLAVQAGGDVLFHLPEGDSVRLRAFDIDLLDAGDILI